MSKQVKVSEFSIYSSRNLQQEVEQIGEIQKKLSQRVGTLQQKVKEILLKQQIAKYTNK